MGYVFVGDVFVDIVDEESVDGVVVVGRSDGVILFLIGSVLNLSFDGFVVDLD